jgi:hypothetical protein
MSYNQKSYELEKARDFVKCQIGSCHGSAILTVNKLNACREHYENFHTSKALKWNHTRGLDTVDKRKDFVSSNIRTTIKSIKTTGV